MIRNCLPVRGFVHLCRGPLWLETSSWGFHPPGPSTFRGKRNMLDSFICDLFTTVTFLGFKWKRNVTWFFFLAGKGMTEEMVGQYLKAHPAFLEAWVMAEVDLETLERWIIRRTQRDKNKQLHNDNNGWYYLDILILL